MSRNSVFQIFGFLNKRFFLSFCLNDKIPGKTFANTFYTPMIQTGTSSLVLEKLLI